MNCYAVHMLPFAPPTGPRPPKAENTLRGPCHKKEKHRGVSRLPLCFSCFPVSRFLIFTVLYFYFSLFFTVSLHFLDLNALDLGDADLRYRKGLDGFRSSCRFLPISRGTAFVGLSAARFI